MKPFCYALLGLALPFLGHAQIAPTSDGAPTFFGPDVRLNLNPDEVVTVERKEDITPGAAPIVVGSDADIPARPASHILDEARVFSEDEFRQLSTLLKDPSHGIEFYVTAHTLLPADTLENYALRVRDAWAQTDTCIVFCYQRGAQLMTMCSADGIYHYLPKPELARSYQKAYAAAGQESNAAGQLMVAVETFINDVSGKIHKIRANNRIFDKGTIKILVALFSTLSLAGVIGIFIARKQKSAAIRSSTTYQFPLLDLPRRFGAPFGGGTTAEIIFDSPQP